MQARVSDAVDALIERHGVDAVVAALRPLISDDRRVRIEAVLDARLSSLTIAIEHLYDPHNGAAAIRSCEAVGVSSMHVVEGAQRFHFAPKVTVGCHKWVDVHRYPDFAACALSLRRAGYTLYAAVPGARESLYGVEVRAPAALVFGNEHDGLTPDAVAACDRSFAIPMHGFSQSLNLSVSVAVSVHTLAARRREVLGRAGDLEPVRRGYLRARWYALAVREAEGVVDRYVSESTRASVGAVTREFETT
jgi:tRNA (guanosine-2'-O-)-methyltransferase